MLKILKYDWKNGWNSVKSTLLAAIILSVVSGVFFGLMGGHPEITGTSFAIVGDSALNKILVVLSCVWFAIMVALFVLTVDAIFKNLSGRMFGPEGYLTHTLPVETWELLGGKALGTWLFGVFMVFVAIASVLLIFLFTAASSGAVTEVLKTIVIMLPKLGQEHYRDIASGFGMLLYGIGAFLAWSLVIVIQFQFICIAARLFGKHYIAGGVIVFVILLSLEGRVNHALSAGFLVSLIFAAVCFYGSCQLLKKRLSIG